MLFWAKMYITTLCPLLYIMDKTWLGCNIIKMVIISNTYNGKALLKRQGALESESCISKGTPALESLLVSTVLTKLYTLRQKGLGVSSSGMLGGRKAGNSLLSYTTTLYCAWHLMNKKLQLQWGQVKLFEGLSCVVTMNYLNTGCIWDVRSLWFLNLYNIGTWSFTWGMNWLDIPWREEENSLV